MTGENQKERATERSAHAIYGLIIITAALVADREAAQDIASSLALLWGAGLVLIVAHLYSAIVAEVGEDGAWLSYAQRHVLIVDNIPVLAALALPSLLILASGPGGLSLDRALDLSVALSVATLFALGAYQARGNGATLQVQLGLGALGGIIGIVVIALEVFL